MSDNMATSSRGDQQPSKFNDALTFKEWLRHVYSEEKAVKISVRTTEVVRPVMLHLHASRDRFRAPIIIHADTFDATPSRDRAVDMAVFVETAKRLLPEAIVSLGWTTTIADDAINRLDWPLTFRLIEYVYDAQQPLILNMRLHDALHSLEQLEWLLGLQRPAIYVLIKGDANELATRWPQLSGLAALASAGHRLLFDVENTWRLQLDSVDVNVAAARKGKRSVETEKWQNVAFPSPSSTLSTSVVSSNGVAFLGWPNSLLISARRALALPAIQRVAGRVRFLARRQIREITPTRRSGLLVSLFDVDDDAHRLSAPALPRAVRVFLGYDGRVSIENHEAAIAPSSSSSTNRRRKKRRRQSRLTTTTSSMNSSSSTRSLTRLTESATGQMPPSSCYGFELVDRGWRVELDVWSERCADDSSLDDDSNDSSTRYSPRYQTFLQLDTPISTSRRTRNVAIGKSGDGVIDFLISDLRHSGAAAFVSSMLPVMISSFTLIFCRVN